MNIFKKLDFKIYAIILIGIILLLGILRILSSREADEVEIGRSPGIVQEEQIKLYREEAEANDGKVIIDDDSLTPEEFREQAEQIQDEVDGIEEVEPSGAMLRQWRALEEQEPLDGL